MTIHLSAHINLLLLSFHNIPNKACSQLLTADAMIETPSVRSLPTLTH